MTIARKTRARLAQIQPGMAVKAVGTIAGGAALGQLIALVASPILTRVYSPENFGVYSAFTAIVGIAGVASAGRFELAIPSARDEGEARTLIGLGVLGLIVSVLVGLLAVAFWGAELERLLNLPGLTQVIWLAPLASSLMGAFLLLNQLAIRDGKFRLIGSRNTVYGLVLVASQIGFGLTGVRDTGLCAGLALASLAGAILLLRGSGLSARGLWQDWRWSVIRRVWSTHRRYPLMLVPAGILNAAGLQLPILIMASAYGPKVAGWLGLTQRVLTIPVALVGTALAQVYLSRVALVHRNRGDVRNLFLRASKHLGFAGLAGGAAVLLAAPVAFQLVFGEPFRPSGEYAQALALGLVGQLVAAPLSQTLIVLGRQSWQLMLDIARAVVLCGLVYAASQLGATPMEAVWALGVGLACSYALAWFSCYRAVGTPAVTSESGPTSAAQ